MSTQPTAPQPAGPGQGGPAPVVTRRILVVDDEAPLTQLVRSYLERDAFEVTIAADGPAAVAAARRVDPDVVVLDLGLPGFDGLEVCRQLRVFSDCYVLILTARSDEVDKIVGLSAGADDYMTKPFSPRELVARVHVLLRRPRASAVTAASRTAGDQADEEAPPRRFGPLTIDVAAREVHLDQALVELTRTEFDLLDTLSAHPKRVFTRAALIATVWDQNWVGDEHLVDVHVGHLRRKLGDEAANARFVRTVRGVGYRMGLGQ
jgi:DNA-binding response OmpR family regulator